MKITDFKLSIRDIELRKDGSSLDSTDVSLSGFWEVDLMKDGSILSQTVGTMNLETGTYKMLRFKLHKTRDVLETDDLYDRSIFIKGTIDGVPFEFWHDTSENFDIENPNGISVGSGQNDVSVVFSIDDFLSSYITIDLSTAQDEDNNGTIAINPDDEDSNSKIADDLKVNIKYAADIIKE